MRILFLGEYILYSDKRKGTFETRINFGFLFAKAISEPLHAVILLLSQRSTQGILY